MSYLTEDPEYLSGLLPGTLGDVSNLRTAIPRIAKDPKCTTDIESAVKRVSTSHTLYLADARGLDFLGPNSVGLVVTSPPYWTLKKYRESTNQLGGFEDYSEFLSGIHRVWEHCYRVLVPGGRLVCVVGDVCLSRRENRGRHTVVPLHAAIQEQCRHIGFDNLAPIIWHKIANVNHESSASSGFLGKPYEPNATIKNDIEFILMQRKPGYRSPTTAERLLSVLSEENHRKWFQQIWCDLPGASTENHPAPYPLELADRLIRMFSFVGDVVLDPFLGTGTTVSAAAKWGRNSIGVETDEEYLRMAYDRIERDTSGQRVRITSPFAQVARTSWLDLVQELTVLMSSHNW